MKVRLRKKIKKFETEMILWNFDSVLQIAKDLEGFPENACSLISSLTTKFGNCGSQRTGYAYVGVPKTMNTIMEIASPWLDLKKGEKKPKAIAV